jgi:hypothetical protein
MYLGVRVIDFAIFYVFSVGFWKCFHSVILFVFPFIIIIISMINKMLTQHQSSPGFIDHIQLYRTSDYVLGGNIFIWSIKPGIDLQNPTIVYYIGSYSYSDYQKGSVNIWNQRNNLIYIYKCS